jgi:hypothetical protein
MICPGMGTYHSIDVPKVYPVRLTTTTTTLGNVAGHRLLQAAREAEDDTTLDLDTLYKADRLQELAMGMEAHHHSKIAKGIIEVVGTDLQVEETTGIKSSIGPGREDMIQNITEIITQDTDREDLYLLDEGPIRIGPRLEMLDILTHGTITIAKGQERHIVADLKLPVPDYLIRSNLRTAYRSMSSDNGTRLLILIR